MLKNDIIAPSVPVEDIDYVVATDAGAPCLLHQAVAEGDMMSIAFMLGEGANINAISRDEHGFSLLQEAVRGKHEGIVRYLLNYPGIDIDYLSTRGASALLLALFEGSKKIRDLLAEKGASVICAAGRTILHYIARTEALDAVKWAVDYMLSKGVSINTKDIHGHSPLHHAARQGGRKVFSYLANYPGIDINIEDNDGRTPLDIASKYRRSEIVQCLLDKGANGTSVTAKPIMQCEAVDYDKLIAESWNTLGYRRPIHRAAGCGNMSLIRRLLLAGEGVNVRDSVGFSPLHYAARSGHMNTVKYLASYADADVNIEDDFGYTPLSIAAKSGELEVVRYLLEKRKADTKNSWGISVLYCALVSERPEIVLYLIKNGIWLTLQDLYEPTVMHETIKPSEHNPLVYLASLLDLNVAASCDINSLVPLMLAKIASLGSSTDGAALGSNALKENLKPESTELDSGVVNRPSKRGGDGQHERGRKKQKAIHRPADEGVILS